MSCARTRLLGASVLALLAAPGACKEFPSIERGVCGNRVIEPGEICDGSGPDGALCGEPGTKNACAFVCDPVTVATEVLTLEPGRTGAECPLGWRCGEDLRCRRPSGELTAVPEPWPFRVDTFAIGDVDGDGNNDVIGHDVSAISVRFGTDSGGFPNDFELTTPSPVGPVELKRFDPDGLLDAVVPLQAGVFVARGTTNRTLEPVPYAPFGVAFGGPVRVVSLEADPVSTQISELLAVTDAGLFFVGGLGPIPLRGGESASDLSSRIPVRDLDAGRDGGREETVLPFRNSTAVYVYSSAGTVRDQSLVPVLRQSIELPPGVRVGSGAFIADVDGDGRLDVLIDAERSGSGEKAVAVAYGDPARSGFVQPTACLVSASATLFGMTGSIHLPLLAVGDLDGDGKADYVTQGEVTVSNGTGPSPAACGMLANTLQTAVVDNRGGWSDAAIGDYNGDGHPDVAVSSSILDSIDIYLGNGAGGFNPRRGRVGGAPFLLRSGDYDGDFIDDVAFAERGFSHDQDVISVIFGSADGVPSRPVRMGGFGSVDQLEPLSAVNSYETLDAISDLLVVSREGMMGGRQGVAILNGSYDRRMLAPFLVRDGDVVKSTVRTLVGNFCTPCRPGASECTDTRDLLAITRTPPADDVPWLVPGFSERAAGLNGSDARPLPLPATSRLETSCANWISGDLDGDGWDEVVGVDKGDHCTSPVAPGVAHLLVARVDPDRTSCPPVFSLEEIDLPPDLVGSGPPVLADVDGDGHTDVLLLFNGNQPGGAPAQRSLGSGLVIVRSVGRRLSPELTAIPSESGSIFVSAAVAQLDADGTPAIVGIVRDADEVDFRDSIYVIRRDAVRGTYGAPVRRAHVGRTRQLLAGDLNGDRLDDIAWIDGRNLQVVFAIDGSIER